MAKSPPAYIQPSVLRWARESIGYTVEEAAAKIGMSAKNLATAELDTEDLHISLRQAEGAARVYERELVDLFRPEPPVEEPQEALFRRLPGAPELPWPPAMRGLARRIRNRQDAAVELLDLLEVRPTWPSQELPSTSSPSVAAEAMRSRLGISLKEQTRWRDRQGYRPLREWRDAVEALGVLVMQDGSLSVEEMRGFASEHPVVPAIVINTKDSARARAFTLFHELGHLMPGDKGEAWCNQFAAETLMPAGAFREIAAREGARSVTDIDQLALIFGVSTYAAAMRVKELSILATGDANRILAAVRARRPAETGSERQGNYYLNKVTWLGPAYMGLVFDALESQAVTYPAASNLLDGAKVDHLPRLQQLVQERLAD